MSLLPGALPVPLGATIRGVSAPACHFRVAVTMSYFSAFEPPLGLSIEETSRKNESTKTRKKDIEGRIQEKSYRLFRAFVLSGFRDHSSIGCR
jgi:hypothetical protein